MRGHPLPLWGKASSPFRLRAVSYLAMDWRAE